MARLQIAASGAAASDTLMRCATGQLSVLKHSLQVTASGLPVLLQPPAWYGDFIDKWVAVSTHARGWHDSMMPHFHTVPAMINDFATLYADTFRIIEPLLNRLDGQPNDQAARAATSAAIASLLDRANSNVGVLGALKAQMTTFTSDLVVDRQTLGDALAQGQATIVADNAQITAMTDKMEELRNRLHGYESELVTDKVLAGVVIGLGVAAAAISYGYQGPIAYVATATEFLAVTTAGLMFRRIMELDQRIAELNREIGEDSAKLSSLQAQVVALTALDATLARLIENVDAGSAIIGDVTSAWSALAQQAADLQADLLDAGKQLDAGSIGALRQDLQAGLQHWADVKPLATGLAALKIVVDPQRYALDGTPLPN